MLEIIDTGFTLNNLNTLKGTVARLPRHSPGFAAGMTMEKKVSPHIRRFGNRILFLASCKRLNITSIRNDRLHIETVIKKK